MGFTSDLRRRLSRWIVPDGRIVRRQYRRKLGRPLPLADPQGLHEKICWLRLNRMTPLHTYCADKITVAAYVQSRAGPGFTARRMFVTRDPAMLSAAAIPAGACVIKANHESQVVFVLHDTARADWDHVRTTMTRSLGSSFYHRFRERQYRAIPPGIIVEELVEADAGAGAGDFNLYCIAGKPRFAVIFAPGAIPEGRPGAAVALDGTPLGISRRFKPFAEAAAPLPPGAARMIEIAERLAEPFPFVRVDFLTAGARFCVSELTFTPFAGYNRFTPESFELAMGALVDLARRPADWRPYLAAARAEEATALPPRR